MSIKIKTKKVVLGTGQAGREILAIKMLSRKKLPEGYLEQKDAMYLYDGDCIKQRIHGYSTAFMRIGDHIAEKDFQKKLENIKVAGEMLSEFNKKMEELRSEWNGEEIFVI